MDKFRKNNNLIDGKGEWDETKHPRDCNGRFANKEEARQHTAHVSFTDFKSSVDAVLSNSYSDTGHIIVSNKTPKILQSIGLDNKVLVISKDVILKLKNKHDLSVEQIKALPQKMTEPFLIMKSFTEPNSIVEYIKDVDKNKKPIMIAILMKKSVRLKNNFIRANVITSAYGRNDFLAHIKKGIETNSILFYNKKRFSNLSVNEGLQLPSIMEDLKPFNNIIFNISKKSTLF